MIEQREPLEWSLNTILTKLPDLKSRRVFPIKLFVNYDQGPRRLERKRTYEKSY